MRTAILWEDIQLCFICNSCSVEWDTNVDVKVTRANVGKQWTYNKDRFRSGEQNEDERFSQNYHLRRLDSELTLHRSSATKKTPCWNRIGKNKYNLEIKVKLIILVFLSVMLDFLSIARRPREEILLVCNTNQICLDVRHHEFVSSCCCTSEGSTIILCQGRYLQPDCVTVPDSPLYYKRIKPD